MSASAMSPAYPDHAAPGRALAIVAVLGLHLALGWLLVSGTAQHRVERLNHTVEAILLQDVRIAPAAPKAIKPPDARKSEPEVLPQQVDAQARSVKAEPAAPNRQKQETASPTTPSPAPLQQRIPERALPALPAPSAMAPAMPTPVANPPAASARAPQAVLPAAMPGPAATPMPAPSAAPAPAAPPSATAVPAQAQAPAADPATRAGAGSAQNPSAPLSVAPSGSRSSAVGTATPAAAPTNPAAQSAPDIAIACPVQVAPQMPPRAERTGETGTVVAQIRVQNGRVSEVNIVSGPRIFHAAVRSAVLQYRCTLSAAEITVTQEFTFRLK